MNNEPIKFKCPWCSQEIELNFKFPQFIECTNCKKTFKQSDVTLQIPKLESWYKNVLNYSACNSLLNYNKKSFIIYKNLSDNEFIKIYEFLNQENHIKFTLTNNSIKTNLTNLSYKNDEYNNINIKLKSLYKQYKTNLKEYNINSLFCTFGELTYSNIKTNKEFSAPLLLLPLSLSYNNKQNIYDFSSINDQIKFNDTLFNFLNENYNVKLNIKTFDLNNIYDLATVFNNVSNYLISQIPSLQNKIKKSFSFCICNYNTYSLAQELKNNGINMLYENSLCNQLGLHANEEYKNNNSSQDSYTYYIDKNLDSYQLNAIKKANSNASFVIFGPPGTGKTQTISNSIINLITHGKTVLVVAEKQTALDEIQKKLDKKFSFNNKYCCYLNLHNNKLKHKEFYNDLNNRIDFIKNLNNKTTLNELMPSINDMHEKLNLYMQNKNNLFELYKKYPETKNIIEKIYELKNANSSINFENFNDGINLINLNKENIDILKNFIEIYSSIKDYYNNYNWLSLTEWNLFIKDKYIQQITNYKNLQEHFINLKKEFETKYSINYVEQIFQYKNLLNLKNIVSENNIFLANNYTFTEIKNNIDIFNKNKQYFFDNFILYLNTIEIPTDESIKIDLDNINKYINNTNNIQKFQIKYKFDLNKINNIIYKNILLNNNIKILNNYLQKFLNEKIKIQSIENKLEKIFNIDQLKVKLFSLIHDISNFNNKNFISKFFNKSKLIKKYNNISKYNDLNILELLNSISTLKEYHSCLETIKKYQIFQNIDLNTLDENFLHILLQYDANEILNDLEILNTNINNNKILTIKLLNYKLNNITKNDFIFLNNLFNEYLRTKYFNNLLISDINETELQIIFNIKNEMQNTFNKYQHIIISNDLLNNFANDYMDIYNIQNNIKNFNIDIGINITNKSIKELTDILNMISNNDIECENICKYNNQFNILKKHNLLDIYQYLKEKNILNNDGLIIYSYLISMKNLKSIYSESEQNFIDINNLLTNIKDFQIDTKLIRLKFLTELLKNKSDKLHEFNIVVHDQIKAKKQNRININKCMTKYIKEILSITPCLLMSPLSVSSFLPEIANLFDVIIFDEASQIYTYNAISALYRSKNAIIVGDDKQLQPTAFFAKNLDETDNLNNNEEAEIQTFSNKSLLDDFKDQFESILLQNHYRSADESLIKLSNKKMYNNELKTFPNAEYTKKYIQFNYISDGIYYENKNIKEAETLVQYLFERLKNDNNIKHKKSIGIITFNSKQQNYIQSLIDNKCLENKEFTNFFNEENNKFWLKNLENVQGDEADIILFSICFGYDKNHKFTENFGPITKDNGSNRLNVAFSRAKEEEIIFSSIHACDIKNRTNNEGTKFLKDFLNNAENYKENTEKNLKNSPKDAITTFIGNYIQELGYSCVYDIGTSEYRINIAVKNKEETKFIHGFKFNTDKYQTSGKMIDFKLNYPNLLAIKYNWNLHQFNYFDIFKNEQKIKNEIKNILENN